MNLETKITIYKFTPQVFTLTRFHGKNKENPRFPCIPCLKKYQVSFGIPSLFF